MNELALPISLIIAPLALVAAAIWPQLSADAVTLAIQPLSSVGGSITQSEGSLVHATKFIDRLISIVHSSRICITFAERSTSLVSIIVVGGIT